MGTMSSACQSILLQDVAILLTNFSLRSRLLMCSLEGTVLSMCVTVGHSVAWSKYMYAFSNATPNYNMPLRARKDNTVSYCMSGRGIFTSWWRVKMQPTSTMITICILTSVIKCLLSIPEQRLVSSHTKYQVTRCSNASILIKAHRSC